MTIVKKVLVVFVLLALYGDIHLLLFLEIKMMRSEEIFSVFSDL